MNMQGAIFDVDGTLLDSMFIWETIGEDYLRHRGITPKPDTHEILKPLSLAQAAAYFQATFGLSESISEIIAEVNQLIEEYYQTSLMLKPGVKEFLQILQQNQVKMCIATATDQHLVEAALKRNGILSYFIEVFTCSQVGAGKDHPKIFLDAWQALGTAKQATFVFEDAIHAIETAKAADFPVVAVYEPAYQKHQKTIQGLADYYLPSFQLFITNPNLVKELFFHEKSTDHCRF